MGLFGPSILRDLPPLPTYRVTSQEAPQPKAPCIDAYLEKVQVSCDPTIIRKWSEDALKHRLFRTDGTAQAIFVSRTGIHLMAYLPGVAWAMYHDWPVMSGGMRQKGSVFVHPQHRHQGIGRAIGMMAWGAWKLHCDQGGK